jgi:GH25 family lysozyme M1 (1,4-beta-N-acetylmuramidase)
MGLSRRTLLASGLASVTGLAVAAETSARGGTFPIQGIDVSRWQRDVDVVI